MDVKNHKILKCIVTAHIFAAFALLTISWRGGDLDKWETDKGAALLAGWNENQAFALQIAAILFIIAAAVSLLCGLYCLSTGKKMIRSKAN